MIIFENFLLLLLHYSIIIIIIIIIIITYCSSLLLLVRQVSPMHHRSSSTSSSEGAEPVIVPESALWTNDGKVQIFVNTLISSCVGHRIFLLLVHALSIRARAHTHTHTHTHTPCIKLISFSVRKRVCRYLQHSLCTHVVSDPTRILSPSPKTRPHPRRQPGIQKFAGRRGHSCESNGNIANGEQGGPSAV